MGCSTEIKILGKGPINGRNRAPMTGPGGRCRINGGGVFMLLFSFGVLQSSCGGTSVSVKISLQVM